VVAAGDFDADEMLSKVQNAFGNIPKQVFTFLGHERRTAAGKGAPGHRGAVQGPIIFMPAYHGPKAIDPDFFPVFVLYRGVVRVGGMSFSGAEPGRLPVSIGALVRPNWPQDVDCGFRPTIDPGTN